VSPSCGWGEAQRSEHQQRYEQQQPAGCCCQLQLLLLLAMTWGVWRKLHLLHAAAYCVLLLLLQVRAVLCCAVQVLESWG